MGLAKKHLVLKIIETSRPLFFLPFWNYCIVNIDYFHLQSFPDQKIMPFFEFGFFIL
jgi:hypothetical protein